jgi:thioredoxin reductase (NADPH)
LPAPNLNQEAAVRDVIIIGSGPAGWTAAIYTARANLRPLVIASSVNPGGDLMNTTEVDNYPGFPDGIQGPDLMEAMEAQAERFGAETIYDDVVELKLEGPVKRVVLGDGSVHEARTVIYATGSQYRHLGLPDEERLTGFGVSWCATCDAFFFKDKAVAVVGGGDSALEEALFLTKFASEVTVIVRGAELRASKTMQDRARANEKIRFFFESEITALRGDSQLEAVRVKTGELSADLVVDGLFIAIGSDPRTHLVGGVLRRTASGTIEVEGRSSRTNVAGVFAAGDVIDPIYRQAITAAASGMVAAADVEHYLAAQPAA